MPACCARTARDRALNNGSRRLLLVELSLFLVDHDKSESRPAARTPPSGAEHHARLAGNVRAPPGREPSASLRPSAAPRCPRPGVCETAAPAAASRPISAPAPTRLRRAPACAPCTADRPRLARCQSPPAAPSKRNRRRGVDLFDRGPLCGGQRRAGCRPAPVAGWRAGRLQLQGRVDLKAARPSRVTAGCARIAPVRQLRAICSAAMPCGLRASSASQCLLLRARRVSCAASASRPARSLARVRAGLRPVPRHAMLG